MHAKRLAWRVACAVVAAALVITGVALYRISPQRGLPYRDSFAAGRAEEWIAHGGIWSVAGGGIRNDSDERGAKLLTGSSHWTNYSLEADVKLLGEDGDAGLVIRSSEEEEGTDSYNGYYAGLRTRDNRLTLGRAHYGWMEFQNEPLPEPLRPFHWYHLTLLAYRCTIVAVASDPDAPQRATRIAVEDQGCQGAGRIALRSYSSGGVWRNVKVQRATASDLAATLAATPVNRVAAGAPAATGITMFGSGSLPSRVNTQQLPRDTAVQSIASLRLAPAAHTVHATVRGVVSLTTPSLYVQDSSGGLAVFPASTPPLKVGDEVQITGSVQAHSFSSELHDASIQLLWARTPVPPLSITPSQAATGSFASMFVELEGTLVEKERTPSSPMMLRLESGAQAFRAIVNETRGDTVFQKLRPNSVVRLRGVCVVDSRFTHNETPFVLLVRSTDDVEVVSGPPWWNTRHVLEIAFVVLVCALLGQFLYNRVERWRLRAILEERELLAHEMHDTLAQSFAALGFQLQAVRNRMPDHMPVVHQQLDLACDLVRHSHEEARRNIMMLRAEALLPMDLAPMLKQCAQKMLAGGGVIIEAAQNRSPREVPLRVNDTLFRIGQEALANSVRHAQPTRIDIRVYYAEDAVRMTIEDDGQGYQPSQEEKGFGVRGMRRRAATISATLEIAGVPGSGTCVTVLAPLPPRRNFQHWTSTLWKRMKTNYEQSRHYPHTHPDRG